jgi:hypothetical protein
MATDVEHQGRLQADYLARLHNGELTSAALTHLKASRSDLYAWKRSVAFRALEAQARTEGLSSHRHEHSLQMAILAEEKATTVLARHMESENPTVSLKATELLLKAAIPTSPAGIAIQTNVNIDVPPALNASVTAFQLSQADAHIQDAPMHSLGAEAED